MVALISRVPDSHKSAYQAEINIRKSSTMMTTTHSSMSPQVRRLVRTLSTSITMGAYSPPGQQVVHTKLKVPLLKSPMYFGHTSQRVNRPYNEDRYAANVLDINDEKVFSFAVFDGHGGSDCSEFLASNLAQMVESDSGSVDKLARDYAKNIGGYWRRWYKHRNAHLTSLQGHPLQLQDGAAQSSNIRLRLPHSFLATDYQFCEKGVPSGSTCTNAFFQTVIGAPTDFYFSRNTVSVLTIAHVGDCKAILVDRNGEANALTQPHHPSNPLESARLNRYATAFMTDSFGEERFIALANTRSFGDVKFKQMGVSAEPDISQLVVGDAAAISTHLSPEEIAKYTINGLGGDESFLVLCSDGVTDILTDQEIADIVMVHYNNKGHPHASPQLGAEEVVRFVEYVGGDDNATCLVIRLNGWGLWPIQDRTGELRTQRLQDFNPRSRGGG